MKYSKDEGSADVFKPRQANKHITGTRRTVGQTVKTIVLFPFMFVASLIFARNLGK